MARRFKLRQAQVDRGEDLNTLIPRLLEQYEGRQGEVAKELGVSQAAVSGWLKNNGFRQVVRWERVEVAS